MLQFFIENPGRSYKTGEFHLKKSQICIIAPLIKALSFMPTFLPVNWPPPPPPHPSVPQEAGGVFRVVTSWSSEADCQSWRSTSRHHLPTGISQLAPAKGEGFPEQYTPFVQRQ